MDMFRFNVHNAVKDTDDAAADSAAHDQCQQRQQREVASPRTMPLTLLVEEQAHVSAAAEAAAEAVSVVDQKMSAAPNDTPAITDTKIDFMTDKQTVAAAPPPLFSEIEPTQQHQQQQKQQQVCSKLVSAI